MALGIEAERIRQTYAATGAVNWLHWGPYLSERQWGTVREDYSPDGTAWDYFPHDHARSRAYRWGEDGLAGLSDHHQQLCFSLALWNGQDAILKERMFGLTNGEGNHGEDVKEYYFYSDSTPTHSYMKWLYKYPQAAFPYAALVDENRNRRNSNPHAPEFELIDTGVFANDAYFDVQVEYAKAAYTDVLVRISVTNRAAVAAPLHVLPTLLFRNTWSWDPAAPRPSLAGAGGSGPAGVSTILATPPTNALGIDPMTLYCLAPDALLFCENESNAAKLWGSAGSAFPKDAINDFVISGAKTVNPQPTGTKASALYGLTIAAGQTVVLKLRLSSDLANKTPFGADFDATFTARIAEADAFYTSLGPTTLTPDQLAIQRQAYAGMLWSKQYYHYIVLDWLNGDPAGPTPPVSRLSGRNSQWPHFYAANVLSMPDAWEYPWFASWDLCFQAVVFARLDVTFAKNQLLLLAREWFMSPDGAVPAYEWAFTDVNPPLHAWAALQIFEIEKQMTGGTGDADFLVNIFSHCLSYFTWWTNRKDSDQRNLFQGGFLGLDNISIIDRSNLQSFGDQLGGKTVEIYQSDGTSWMGMFCLNLMDIALNLSRLGMAEYDRFANRFFQHFIFIADAMNSLEERSGGQVALWDGDDNFYYDALHIGGDDQYLSVKLPSLVGIIPIFAVTMLDLDWLQQDSCGDDIRARVAWFEKRHPELLQQVIMQADKNNDTYLLSMVQKDRLKLILQRVFDELQLLSPHGVRGISKAFGANPFTINVDDATLTEQYEPAESSNGLFGGNSNWRGPVWFPINFLLIDALRRYHLFLGDGFTVEYPTGSGVQKNLLEIASDLSQRMVSIFERGTDGTRPVYGGTALFQQDANWRDHLLFFEYFHGDNGAGIGASHQTGWTGLVAELLQNI